MSVYGYRAEKTWARIAEVLPELSDEVATALRGVLAGPPGEGSAEVVVQALKADLARIQGTDRSERVKAWKRRLQSSEKKAYEWLKKSGKVQAKAMRLADG
eukprot:16446484-Heterocapsa_arctica.AAC.1